MKFSLLILLLSSYSFAEPNYAPSLSEHAKPDYTTLLGKHSSPYLVVLEACYKIELSAFNIVHADVDRRWRQSIICYENENFNLPMNLRVNLDKCASPEIRRGRNYDQAHCMQGEIFLAHNALMPKKE